MVTSRQDLVLFLRKMILDSTGSSYNKSSYNKRGKYRNLLKFFFDCKKCKSKCLVILDFKLKIANIYQNNVVHNHELIKTFKKPELNVLLI